MPTSALSNSPPKSVSRSISHAATEAQVRLGVKPEQLHADGWAIGFDDRFPSNIRVQQALLFARWDRHENLYAHPMVCLTATPWKPSLIAIIRTSSPS